MANDDKSAMYERGAATTKAIGNASPGPGRERYAKLPPERADDVQRMLVEFCFGNTWGREGSHIDLRTWRLLTIAALVSQGQERQLRGRASSARRASIQGGRPHISATSERQPRTAAPGPTRRT